MIDALMKLGVGLVLGVLLALLLTPIARIVWDSLLHGVAL